MQADNFAGDKKEGTWFLKRAEDKLANFLVPLVPKCIETYHLTAMTILWSILIVLSGFLADKNPHWFCLSSFAILFQYITDLIDGKVGKARNTGLIRWGYYMDHFLDYIFLCSILISYSFVVSNDSRILLFFILAIFGAFMVNAYLSFAATNEFKISFFNFGPTESRVLFIIVNTFLIFGKSYASQYIPYVLVLSFVALCVVVYNTQKYIWKIDMDNKNKANH